MIASTVLAVWKDQQIACGLVFKGHGIGSKGPGFEPRRKRDKNRRRLWPPLTLDRLH
jgi:hypothetical protein